MSSKLTLQKEQTGRLILDGPQEVISSSLARFRDLNKEEATKAAQEATIAHKESVIKNAQREKELYAMNFMACFQRFSRINSDQFRDIVTKLKDSEMSALEDVVAKTMYRRAFLSLSFISLVLISGLSCFLYYSSNDNSGLATMSLFLSLITLGFFFTDTTSSRALLFKRRKLKKIYGQNYFPYQELKNKLELK